MTGSVEHVSQNEWQIGLRNCRPWYRPIARLKAGWWAARGQWPWRGRYVDPAVEPDGWRYKHVESGDLNAG